MDLNLRDRRALVTGATAGIGRAVALSLAAEGVRLAMVGRRSDLLDQVCLDCRSVGSPAAVPIVLDMMRDDAPESAASLATEALGGIDILINCMGRSRTITLDESDQGWDESMTLNWNRHRQLTSFVLPGMRQRGWGRVLNITGPNEVSISGPESVMGLNSAAVAKATVHAWAKGVSDLVAREGITVNCVGPGKILSEQIERNYTPEARKALSEKLIPAGRFGEAAELADLVTFLASTRASYITGVVIPVDGGLKRYMF